MMTTTVQQFGSSLLRRLTGLFLGKIARSSGWLLVGSIVGGLFGYVYQVLMGRMLSTQEYGLFSAMMALFIILGAPLGTLMMVISRKVSEYRTREDWGSITHFYLLINVRSAIVGLLLLGFGFLLAEQARLLLKAPSTTPVYLLAMLLVLTALPFINNAFLQGMQSFSWLSASSALLSLFKVVFSVALVWLGFGLAGAIGGAVLATIAIWLVTCGALYRPLVNGRRQRYNPDHLSLRETLPVLLANAAFGVMSQLDMMLVNYFFSPHDASLYAAASILGKAVMYLPGGIVLALFPLAAESHVRGEEGLHLLRQAVGLVLLLCGLGAIFYFLFGEWFVLLLYGEEYREAGQILRYYGFAIMPMSLVMVAEYFLIARGRVMFAYLFSLIAPFQMLVVYWYHKSLLTVVSITAVFGLLLACIGFSMLWQSFKGKS